MITGFIILDWAAKDSKIERIEVETVIGVWSNVNSFRLKNKLLEVDV